MKKLLLIATLFVATFATSVHAMDKLTITDAWLRVAPNKVAGAFFELHNQSDKDLKVISAIATGAQKVELHSHTMTDGIMKMRKEDYIEVPANGVLSFNPHSFHLMMFRLDQEVFAVGEMVDVVLTFDDNSTMGAQFQVIKFGQEFKPSMDHTKMDHSKMTMPKK